MLAVMAFAAMVSLSKDERDAEFDKPPHNTLTDCGSTFPEWGDCRLPADLSAADIEAKLGDKDTAWWRDGDQFIVVARRDTDQAYLCCSARGRMDHVSGDLWALRLHIADLDHATLDVFVKPDGKDAGAYRGPAALPKPEYATSLQGRMLQIQVNSKFLDAPRNLWIYLPPGHDPKKTYPVVYMSDGALREADAKMIEPLILKSELPPMILVEIWPGLTQTDIHLRAEEYLWEWQGGMPNFLKHESFLTKEVMPYVEQTYGASTNPQDRVVTGFSSGAAWAVEMGLRHPDLFPKVIAQSMGWTLAETGIRDDKTERFYLTAGTLEPAFYKETLHFADAARASGHQVVLQQPVGGHTPTVWNGLLLEGLKWAYPKPDGK